MEYTPGRIWSILIGESVASFGVDEAIDLKMALAKMPPVQQSFLVMISQGYKVAEVMRRLEITENQTRFRREALMKLTALMNGESSHD
jgi:hypothetical protein